MLPCIKKALGDSGAADDDGMDETTRQSAAMDTGH